MEHVGNYNLSIAYLILVNCMLHDKNVQDIGIFEVIVTVINNHFLLIILKLNFCYVIKMF